MLSVWIVSSLSGESKCYKAGNVLVSIMALKHTNSSRNSH